MRISRDCFANFVADFRTTFVRVSRECRENFLVSRTSRELVAKFFNMLKNFMRFFSPKYFARLSRDSRATFVRVSRTCRREILANLQCEIFATFVRECRTTVARHSRENLATIWRENKTKRHSYECRATLARMSRDFRTNLNENKLHSRESRETLSRMSRDCRATVGRLSRDIFSKLDRNSRICRKNVYSMRLQRESFVYIVYLCREIVANYSRTSLQLSHSSEIGAEVHVIYRFSYSCKN